MSGAESLLLLCSKRIYDVPKFVFYALGYVIESVLLKFIQQHTNDKFYLEDMETKRFCKGNRSNR